MANTDESRGYEKAGKRVWIQTFGCQMNERDSEDVLGMLTAESR